MRSVGVDHVLIGGYTMDCVQSSECRRKFSSSNENLKLTEAKAKDVRPGFTKMICYFYAHEEVITSVYWLYWKRLGFLL